MSQPLDFTMCTCKVWNRPMFSWDSPAKLRLNHHWLRSGWTIIVALSLGKVGIHQTSNHNNGGFDLSNVSRFPCGSGGQPQGFSFKFFLGLDFGILQKVQNPGRKKFRWKSLLLGGLTTRTLIFQTWANFLVCGIKRQELEWITNSKFPCGSVGKQRWFTMAQPYYNDDFLGWNPTTTTIFWDGTLLQRRFFRMEPYYNDDFLGQNPTTTTTFWDRTLLQRWFFGMEPYYSDVFLGWNPTTTKIFRGPTLLHRGDP